MLQKINSNREWSVVAYDVKRTDSVISPLLAIVDLRWDPHFETGALRDIKIRYQAFAAYQEGTWVLKRLEKSYDQDGSMRAGRTKDVTGEDNWTTLRRFFR